MKIKLPVKKILSISAFCFLFLNLLFVNTAFAAAAVSLNPSSGSVQGNFTVKVVLNTDGTAVNGVDLDVNFTGPVSFISGATGNIGCTPTFTPAVGKVSIVCLIPPPTTFNGAAGEVATLTFTTTGSGTVTMTPANVDLGGPVATVSGATYAASVGSLPDTGIFEIGLIGISPLLLAVSLYTLNKKFDQSYTEVETGVVESERGMTLKI